MGHGKNYILLDGVLRHDVLKAMGQDQAFCLIATEDETYTYNHKVNRLTPLQQHFMILRAVESGVSEERIADTLNVDVANIRLKIDLLKGICPEAVELLKDCKAHAKTFQALRKVKPIRQIEMAELMVASNNYTGSYAECLLAATPQNKLVNITKPKEVHGLSAEEMDRMEREMDALSEDFKLIEEAPRQQRTEPDAGLVVRPQASQQRRRRPVPVQAPPRHPRRVPNTVRLLA